MFHAGRLADAVQAATAEVKSSPLDAESRYRLFAFLCFAGDLERADRQLDAIGAQDAQIEVGSRIYRHLLAAEMNRRKAFGGGAEPLLPPDAPLHAVRRREALGAIRSNDAAGAAKLIDAAAEASPALEGTADGRAFTALRDSDDLLASVLEVFAGGRYLWLPFERIRSLTISPPRTLLDLVWASAELEDADGTRANVHVPALYPGSFESPVEAIRLGRATEWPEVGGLARAAGQRILDASFRDGTAGVPGEIPILALRSLVIAGGASTESTG